MVATPPILKLWLFKLQADATSLPCKGQWSFALTGFMRPNLCLDCYNHSIFDLLRVSFLTGVIKSDGWGQERARKTSYPV